MKALATKAARKSAPATGGVKRPQDSVIQQNLADYLGESIQFLRIDDAAVYETCGLVNDCLEELWDARHESPLEILYKLYWKIKGKEQQRPPYSESAQELIAQAKEHIRQNVHLIPMAEAKIQYYHKKHNEMLEARNAFIDAAKAAAETEMARKELEKAAKSFEDFIITGFCSDISSIVVTIDQTAKKQKEREMEKRLKMVQNTNEEKEEEFKDKERQLAVANDKFDAKMTKADFDFQISVCEFRINLASKECVILNKDHLKLKRRMCGRSAELLPFVNIADMMRQSIVLVKKSAQALDRAEMVLAKVENVVESAVQVAKEHNAKLAEKKRAAAQTDTRMIPTSGLFAASDAAPPKAEAEAEAEADAEAEAEADDDAAYDDAYGDDDAYDDAADIDVILDDDEDETKADANADAETKEDDANADAETKEDEDENESLGDKMEESDEDEMEAEDGANADEIEAEDEANADEIEAEDGANADDDEIEAEEGADEDEQMVEDNAADIAMKADLANVLDWTETKEYMEYCNRKSERDKNISMAKRGRDLGIIFDAVEYVSDEILEESYDNTLDELRKQVENAKKCNNKLKLLAEKVKKRFIKIITRDTVERFEKIQRDLKDYLFNGSHYINLLNDPSNKKKETIYNLAKGNFVKLLNAELKFRLIIDITDALDHDLYNSHEKLNLDDRLENYYTKTVVATRSNLRTKFKEIQEIYQNVTGHTVSQDEQWDIGEEQFHRKEETQKADDFLAKDEESGKDSDEEADGSEAEDEDSSSSQAARDSNEESETSSSDDAAPAADKTKGSSDKESDAEASSSDDAAPAADKTKGSSDEESDAKASSSDDAAPAADQKEGSSDEESDAKANSSSGAASVRADAKASFAEEVPQNTSSNSSSSSMLETHRNMQEGLYAASALSRVAQNLWQKELPNREPSTTAKKVGEKAAAKAKADTLHTLLSPTMNKEKWVHGPEKGLLYTPFPNQQAIARYPDDIKTKPYAYHPWALLLQWYMGHGFHKNRFYNTDLKPFEHLFQKPPSSSHTSSTKHSIIMNKVCGPNYAMTLLKSDDAKKAPVVKFENKTNNTTISFRIYDVDEQLLDLKEKILELEEAAAKPYFEEEMSNRQNIKSQKGGGSSSAAGEGAGASSSQIVASQARKPLPALGKSTKPSDLNPKAKVVVPPDYFFMQVVDSQKRVYYEKEDLYIEKGTTLFFTKLISKEHMQSYVDNNPDVYHPWALFLQWFTGRQYSEKKNDTKDPMRSLYNKRNLYIFQVKCQTYTITFSISKKKKTYNDNHVTLQKKDDDEAEPHVYLIYDNREAVRMEHLNKLKAKVRKYEREFDTHHRPRRKEIDWELIQKSLKTANDDADHAQRKAIKAFMKAEREKEQEADEKEGAGKKVRALPTLSLSLSAAAAAPLVHVNTL